MDYLLYLIFRCDRRCDGCDGKFGNLVGTKHTPYHLPPIFLQSLHLCSLLCGQLLQVKLCLSACRLLLRISSMGGDPYLTVRLIILASWCEKQERYCVVLVTSKFVIFFLDTWSTKCN